MADYEDSDEKVKKEKKKAWEGKYAYDFLRCKICVPSPS